MIKILHFLKTPSIVKPMMVVACIYNLCETKRQANLIKGLNAN